MTHIPSKVIIGTSEDLPRVKASYDKWCGGDITEKYGVEFLTVEEAKEKGINLQDALPFSSVDIDDSAKPFIKDAPTKQDGIAKKSRSKGGSLDA